MKIEWLVKSRWKRRDETETEDLQPPETGNQETRSRLTQSLRINGGSLGRTKEDRFKFNQGKKANESVFNCSRNISVGSEMRKRKCQ